MEHKRYNHTCALLENLEEFYAECAVPDLPVVCRDGIFQSYRLLVGGCSELLRECLEVHLPEEACLVLPNIDLWEFKAFHSALLCYRDTPSLAELDAVLKVLTTMGVNLGAYVDVNLASAASSCSELENMNQLPNICFLNIDTKLGATSPSHQLDAEKEIAIVLPNSVDVLPIVKSGKQNMKIMESGGNQMTRLVKQEPLDRIRIATVVDSQSADNSRLSHIKQHNIRLQKDVIPASLDNQKENLGEAENIRKYTCEICKKNLSTASALATHLEFHAANPEYPCDQCDKKFVTKSKLTNHVRFHKDKSDGAKFLCNKCNKNFTHPSNLRRHLNSVHIKDGERKFECSLCLKKFKDSSTLKTHVENHKAVRRFPCSLCSNSYVKNSQLETHMRTHSGVKPYVCNMCNKAFKTAGNLKSHMMARHVGVKLAKSNLCPQCGQGFVKEYDLRVHIRRHQGERPFGCLTCGKSFRSERHFVEHSRTHTGEKPFQCETCNRSFSTCSGLRQHFKSYANCRMQATEGAYSKSPSRRKEWRMGNLQQMSNLMLPEAGQLSSLETGGHITSLEGITVQQLKDNEETVVYLSTDTDLSLVAGEIMSSEIESTVQLQGLPLVISTEGNGEVINLVEMSEKL